MDKSLLKKFNLLESQKKFQKLYEYTFITDDLNEDDDETEQNSQGNPPMNDTDVLPQQETPNQSQSNNDSDDEIPDDNINSMPQTGNNNVQTGNDAELGDTLELGDTSDETDDIEMDSDEEVIDVDDLTSSQEETELKVGEVDDKLTQLLSLVDKFEHIISQNDSKIEDLRKEFALRNPTEVEKLNMRSQDSLPFTVSPKDYWEDKSKNSNYDVSFNNSVSPNDEEKEYIIRKGDIENSNNPKSISNSFNINDDEYDTDMTKIFGY